MSDTSSEYSDIEDPDTFFGPAPQKFEPLPPLSNIFDSKDQKKIASTDDLLDYLAKKYQFFLPEQEFITDKEGLMAYLNEKIGQGLTCIFCNKGFYSLEAVQQHMRETPGHAKLNITGTLELSKK